MQPMPPTSSQVQPMDQTQQMPMINPSGSTPPVGSQGPMQPMPPTSSQVQPMDQTQQMPMINPAVQRRLWALKVPCKK